MITKKYYSNKKGFALLLAVVISSVLISITFIMFSISLKQINLAIAGKNSQIALYAADTGIECALFTEYWVDNAFVNIVSNTDGGGNTTLTISAPSSAPAMNCNGVAVSFASPFQAPTLSGGQVVSKFKVSPYNSSTNSSCAEVTITKYKVTNIATDGKVTEVLKTHVESRGYNTCTNLNDPQRLERGLEVFY